MRWNGTLAEEEALFYQAMVDTREAWDRMMVAPTAYEASLEAVKALEAAAAILRAVERAELDLKYYARLEARRCEPGLIPTGGDTE